MNDKTNIQQVREEKKKSIIVSEKSKTLSAKTKKENTAHKLEKEAVVGPSAHSIPPS